MQVRENGPELWPRPVLWWRHTTGPRLGQSGASRPSSFSRSGRLGLSLCAEKPRRCLGPSPASPLSSAHVWVQDSRPLWETKSGWRWLGLQPSSGLGEKRTSCSLRDICWRTGCSRAVGLEEFMEAAVSVLGSGTLFLGEER